MRTKLLMVLGLFVSIQLTAQMAKRPHVTLYHNISGKNAILNFNEQYWVQLHVTAFEKLNNFTLQDSTSTYLTLLNQIGDTLVFKEGKLLATDIDKLVYTNRATEFFMVMAATVYMPVFATFTYIYPEGRFYMLLAVPPTLILTNIFLRGFERKLIPFNQYHLIPQNILGKPPHRKWF